MDKKMNEHDEFENWLAHVARLDANTDVEFNAENHRQVLRELGYSDDELARVDSAVANHLAQARNHVRFGRWVDAVRAFERALLLAPWLTDVWVETAESHLRAYEQTQSTKHAESCEKWARKRIEARPDEEAPYAILNQLDYNDVVNRHRRVGLKGASISFVRP